MSVVFAKSCAEGFLTLLAPPNYRPKIGGLYRRGIVLNSAPVPEQRWPDRPGAEAVFENTIVARTSTKTP